MPGLGSARARREVALQIGRCLNIAAGREAGASIDGVVVPIRAFAPDLNVGLLVCRETRPRFA
jgi:hypothetical protein